MTRHAKPPEQPPFWRLFIQAGQKHQVPPMLLAAQAAAESSFNPSAVSKAGAQGLMQLEPRFYPNIDPFDPAQAIPAAAESMSRYYLEFGEWRLALAAYNWGPGNLTACLAAKEHRAGWPLETRYYVTHVMVLWARYQKTGGWYAG